MTAKSLEERLQVIEDRNELADLQARYVNLNDGGWGAPTHRHPEQVANLFTEDGVWNGPLGAVTATGRVEIAGLFRNFQAIPFIVHHVMNPLIEISGDTARAEWHAIVATTASGGQAFWTFGRYLNEYRRTAEGWRYTTMTFEAAAISIYEKGWAVEQFLGRDSVPADFDRDAACR